jgi:hypothetical protein
MRTSSLALAAVLAVLAAGPGRADVVTLTDGSKREGKVVKDCDQEVVLEVTQGRLKAEVTFKRSEVKSIEKGPTAAEKLLAEVEKRKAQLKDDDAAGWVEYARWLDRQSGFSRDARAAWEKVVKIDPDNEAARTKLGYQKVGGQWLTEDEIMAAKGLVKSGDKWVKPEEKAAADEKLAKQAEDLKIAAAEDVRKEREKAAQAEADKLAAWRKQMEALAAQRAAENAPGFAATNSGGVVLGPYGYGYYGVYSSNGQYLPFVPYTGSTVYYTGPGWPYSTGTVWPTYTGYRRDTRSGGLFFNFQYNSKHVKINVGGH